MARLVKMQIRFWPSDTMTRVAQLGSQQWLMYRARPPCFCGTTNGENVSPLARA